MSTSLSSTATTGVPTLPSGCAGSRTYEHPIKDPACAVPNYGNSNYTDVMEACCGDADVVSYYSGCGLYCVALDQTVEELTECLYGKGAAYADVFCNVNATAAETATATGNVDAPASASATVISGSGKDDDKDSDKDSNDDDDNDDSSSSTTESSSSSSATNSDNAAPGVVPHSGLSTVGFAVGALLFSSMALGAFQI